MPLSRAGRVCVVLAHAALAAVFHPRDLAAQRAHPVEVWDEVFVGSEAAEYLRVLQTAGVIEQYPWSIRGFGLREVERLAPPDSAHPWAKRYAYSADPAGRLHWSWIAPRVQAIYNTDFPFGSNDGVLWSGRGLTTALQAGFAVRSGPLSLVVAPVAFRAENAAFELMSNGREGRLAFADAWGPMRIDHPQRFGDDAYGRIDPGESTVRLDLSGLTIGLSTAAQHWGPASRYPILLGNNAPGFLHGFVGTSAPWDVWVGRIHGRMVWGRLVQSDYSSTRPPGERFASGIVGVFSPRGIPALEIGVARFFHLPWPENGLEAEDFLKPLESFIKSNLPDDIGGVDGRSDAANQLASAFVRWFFPKSGVEVYGEYGREDHSWDVRDFWLEPDHDSAYLLGLQKVWKRSPTRWWAVRAEVVNAQRSHLRRVRPQTTFYTHSVTRQGHTQRGQVLGSPAVYGGAGAIVMADYYHPGGRWSFGWTRELRQDAIGGSFDPGLVAEPDLIHTLGSEVLFFRGAFEVGFGVTGVYNLNRNFAGDVFNLRADVELRAHF